jgi:signal recognition particle receptor subunit beta
MGGPSGLRDRTPDPASQNGDVAGHVDPGLRIGTSLAWGRAKLIEAGDILCEVFEPAGAGVVADAVRVLKHQVCRIAVIGQIKAGKSCFINALVQQHDFLPTDVNPWTTATTNVHLHPRPEGTDAAVFQFFAASEWEQLAEGGGKLRELTERLDPGFEPELLRRHLSALKTRAAKRLGPEFTTLLGRQHRFPAPSRDTLKQYVCQGDPDDPSVGRYSDITKSADIYLQSGPFDYPVTVIDTPGTNDPCLIRDEITRRSLESADLYIVVLTARQPLSAADVALLRILRGLHKERFVVFVNRIDELADIAADNELVLASVENWLRKEFADADIALVVGSAWWANCAFAGETANFDQLVGSRAIDYLQRQGFLPRKHRMSQAGTAEAAGTSLRAALFAASGLNQVYVALDELLGRSHYASVLRQLTSSFSEMVRASESAAREELQSLARSHSGTLSSAEGAQRELLRLRDELQALNKVSSVIDSSGALFKERQMDVIAREMTSMRIRLLANVNECARIAKELQADVTSPAWNFDSQQLRHELACQFVDSFQRAEDQLLALQHDVVPHLRSLLARLVPDASVVMKSQMGHRSVRPPSMMPLGATLPWDLDSSWLSLLWKVWPSPSQRGRKLERLINTEFGRVVEELVDACERSLTDYAVATTEWTFGICDSIAQSISRRRKQLVAYYENLEREIEGTADSQTESAHQRYIVTFNEHLDKCKALRCTLDEIARQIGPTVNPLTLSAPEQSLAARDGHHDKCEILGRELGRIGRDNTCDVPSARG